MVKVISLSDKAYNKLKAIKGERSFSEVVIEITSDKKKKKENILRLAGAFKDDARKWETIKKEIYEDRKKFKLREYKW